MSLGKINLITPPDVLFNLSPTFLLVKPSTAIKMQFQKLLSTSMDDINVFIYDTDENDVAWMLNAAVNADVVIIDVDNCDPTTKNFIGYVLGQPNAYYLTADEITPWQLINRNRIYDLNWIASAVTDDDGDEEDNDERLQ
jgi:hypothetical protein